MQQSQTISSRQSANAFLRSCSSVNAQISLGTVPVTMFWERSSVSEVKNKADVRMTAQTQRFTKQHNQPTSSPARHTKIFEPTQFCGNLSSDRIVLQLKCLKKRQVAQL